MNSTSLLSCRKPAATGAPKTKGRRVQGERFKESVLFCLHQRFLFNFFYYTCIDLFGGVCILYHEYRSQKGTCGSQFVINQAEQQASALHAEPYCSLRKSHGAQVAGQLLILLPQPPGCHLVHERVLLGTGETETSLKLPLLSGIPLGTRSCLCL